MILDIVRKLVYQYVLNCINFKFHTKICDKVYFFVASLFLFAFINEICLQFPTHSGHKIMLDCSLSGCPKHPSYILLKFVTVTCRHYFK